MTPPSRMLLAAAVALAAPLPSAAATYNLSASVAAMLGVGAVPLLPAERAQAELTLQQDGNANASGAVDTLYEPPAGSTSAATTVSLSGAVSGAALGASAAQALFVPIPLSFDPARLLTDLPPEFAPGNVDEPLYTTTISWVFDGIVDLTSNDDPGTWAGGYITVALLDTHATDANGDFLPARQVVREDALGFESVRAPAASMTAGDFVSCGQETAYSFRRTGQMEMIYGPGDEARYQLALTIGGASFGAFCRDQDGRPVPPPGPGEGFPQPFDRPFDLALIPLPASALLLLGGLAMLAGLRRRRGA